MRRLLGAVGDEGESRAVRRPAGRRVLLRPGRQGNRLAAGRLHEPDLRAIVVLILIRRGDDKGDPAAVRRGLRVADEAEVIEIAREDEASFVGHIATPVLCRWTLSAG